MACNCRKKSSSVSRSVMKKTGTTSMSTRSIVNRQGGVINGRRIITRTIK